MTLPNHQTYQDDDHAKIDKEAQDAENDDAHPFERSIKPLSRFSPCFTHEAILVHIEGKRVMTRASVSQRLRSPKDCKPPEARSSFPQTSLLEKEAADKQPSATSLVLSYIMPETEFMPPVSRSSYNHRDH